MSDTPAAGPARTNAADSSYDPTTIRLHWATAVLVVLLWSVAQIIDLFPVGPARWNVRSVHMLLGLGLGCVLVWRVWWRATGGRRLPATAAGADAARKVVHALLYLLLIGAVALGSVNAWARGDQIFTWFKLPALVIAGVNLRQRVAELHAIAANTLLGLAGVHVAAALIHHFVLRDGILARMLPWPALRPAGRAFSVRPGAPDDSDAGSGRCGA